MEMLLEFLLCRNHLISIKTLSGAPPPPLGHPPVAIVPYCLYTIMEKLPVQKFPALLCTGKCGTITTGRLIGGAKPRERQVTQNDFSRAKKNQYPMTTRITLNAANPIRALTGMVRIHAHTMVRATPHFTVLLPLVIPTPMMDVQIIWVVLTGIPRRDAPIIVDAPAVSAANPCTGRSFVIL
jgi:hypothetical protein